MSTTEKGVMVPLWAMEDCEGDPRDAMLWAQITWWFQPAQRDGTTRTKHLVERHGETWMYTTDAELAEETGMSADQVYRARRALVKRGLLESRSAVVLGQKMTLVRPTAEPRDEDEQTADSRNPAADSRNQETAEPRELPLLDRGRTARETARAEADRQFEEHFWPAYPARRGLKHDKGKALTQWRRLSLDDRRAALKGARNYAASGELPKDAFRWLRDRCWESWQVPATPLANGNGKHAAASAGHQGNMAELAELLERDQ